MKPFAQRAAALFLTLALLFSLCLPISLAEHDCAGECCAFCHVVELSLRLLGALLFCVVCLRLCRTAVRAFVRARAAGRLFYTPVVLKVKLSD